MQKLIIRNYFLSLFVGSKQNLKARHAFENPVGKTGSKNVNKLSLRFLICAEKLICKSYRLHNYEDSFVGNNISMLYLCREISL